MSKKKPANKSYNDFFFDDCPICRAMKAAEDDGRSLTEPELRAAFKKAKNKGAAFGKEE